MFPAILLGPLMKIGFYIVGSLVAVGIVLGAYSMWKRSVIAEANQALIIRQLEEAVAAANKAAEDQKKMREIVDGVVAEVKKQRELDDRRFDEIEGSIDGAEDRPASDVLKNTIKQLKGGR